MPRAGHENGMPPDCWSPHLSQVRQTCDGLVTFPGGQLQRKQSQLQEQRCSNCCQHGCWGFEENFNARYCFTHSHQLSLVTFSKTFGPVGGTRFIGVYLARQLVEAGHEVTLLTRGKKPVTFQIPDDTDQGFEQYKSSVKHIAADRTDAEALKQQLSGAGFQGTK